MQNNCPAEEPEDKHEGQCKRKGLSFDNNKGLDLRGEVEQAGDTENGMPVGDGNKVQNIGGSKIGPTACSSAQAPPPQLLSVATIYPYMIKAFMYDRKEYTMVELYTNDCPLKAFMCWVPAEKKMG